MEQWVFLHAVYWKNRWHTRNVPQKEAEYMWFEVLTAVMTMVVFWTVMMYGLVGGYQQSRGTYCLHLLLQTAGTTYKSNWCCNPEDHHGQMQKIPSNIKSDAFLVHVHYLTGCISVMPSKVIKRNTPYLHMVWEQHRRPHRQQFTEDWWVTFQHCFQ